MNVDKDVASEARDRAADLRDDAAEGRDTAAVARDQAADERDVKGRARDEASRSDRDSEADRLADRTAPDDAAVTEAGRHGAAADREAAHAFLDRLREYEAGILADRRAAAADRHAAAEDRRAAARDRELGAWARQQAAIEAAEMTAAQLARLTEQPPAPGVEAEPSPPPGSGTVHRVKVGRQEAASASAQRAADLAREVAESEEKVAATLRSLATHGDPAASARRLALADAAAVGRRVAIERSGRLKALAERAADDLVMATLRTLLDHAYTTSTAMAETESSIAGAMELLATHEYPEGGADYAQEAERARAASDTAFDRAQALKTLESALVPQLRARADEQPQAPGDAED